MKKKLTIIDIIIVLLILLVIGFAGIKLIGSIGNKTDSVTYTVLVNDHMPEIARTVVPADNVLLDPVQEVYGKVTDVELKPSEKYMFNSISGQFVKQTTEDRVDIYLTVEAPVTRDDYGVAVGEKYLRVGYSQGINGPGYAVTGYIVDVME